MSWTPVPRMYSSMVPAMRLPSAMARITVAEPRTMSPPANTPGRLVMPRSSAHRYPWLVTARSGDDEVSKGLARVPTATTTVSHGMTRSDPSIGTGVRLPDASGSPSSVSDAAQPGDPSIGVAFDGDRADLELELDAFLFGVVDFFFAGGHLRPAAAVNDAGRVGAETTRRAYRVDCHVAGTDHHDALTMQDWRVGIREGVCLHQVDSSQIFVRRVDPLQPFAGHAEEGRQTGTDRYEHGVELLPHLVEGVGAADDDVALNAYAEVLEASHLVLDDVIRQPELGDAVRQHAAWEVQCFIDRHVVPAAGKLAGRRQSAGAGANDRYPLSGSFDSDRLLVHMTAGPIGNEPFEVADRHRRALAAAHALRLALVLLRTYPARHRRQRVVAEECFRRAGKVAVFDLADKGGDIDCHRAALDARRAFAGQAALRFEEREVFGEAQIDLVEGPRAGGCIPGRHRLTVDRQTFPFGQRFRRCARHHPAPRQTWADASCSASR